MKRSGNLRVTAYCLHHFIFNDASSKRYMRGPDRGERVQGIVDWRKSMVAHRLTIAMHMEITATLQIVRTVVAIHIFVLQRKRCSRSKGALPSFALVGSDALLKLVLLNLV
jgi:hypothetical protein